MSHGADRVDVLWPIPGHALPLATPTALAGDNGVRGADSAQARGDLRALRREALGLVASGCDGRRPRLETRGPLWGATWPRRSRLVVGTAPGRVHTLARHCRLDDRLLRRSRLRGAGGGESGAPCLLPLAEVRRVRRPQVRCTRGEKPRSCSTGRWHPCTGEPRQRLYPTCLPGGLSACLRHVLPQQRVAHGLAPPQAETARQGCLLRPRALFGGHLVSQTRARLGAGGPASLFHTTVDRRRRPVRSTDKPLAARALPA